MPASTGVQFRKLTSQRGEMPPYTPKVVSDSDIADIYAVAVDELIYGRLNNVLTS